MKEKYKLAQRLYDLLEEQISITIRRKICVPISGGLDSRVIAAIISKYRTIDLSFCYHQLRFKDFRSFEYAQQISKVLKIKEFYCIKPDVNYVGINFNQPAIKIMNDLRPLKDYLVIVPLGLETMTGDQINLKTILTGEYKRHEAYYWKHVWAQEKENIKNVWGKYGQAWNPVDDEELIEFCRDLPLKYRIHQNLYRYMIREFLPEVAGIPQERVHYPLDSSLWLYGYYRGVIKKRLGIRL